jgi:hypothetical protein
MFDVGDLVSIFCEGLGVSVDRVDMRLLVAIIQE